MKWTGIILLFLSLGLSAQDDTALQYVLPDYTLVDSNKVIQKSERVSLINKGEELFYTHKNVSDLLEDKSGFFVKNYGIGSLSTVSSRGTASVHTAIVWNGVAINSPMNGLLDLNLIPVSLMQDVKLTEGNRTAQYGSGSVGATILLENKAHFIASQEKSSSKMEVSFQPYIASFGNKGYHVSAIISSKKMYFSMAFLQREAENNFEFTNYTKINSPVLKQKNAAYSNQGLMTEFGYKINDKNTITARFWKQDADREIPPTLIQNENVSKQIDQTIRTGIFHEYRSRKASLQNSVTFLKESINYIDKAANLDEKNLANNLIFQSVFSYQLQPRFLSKTGIIYNDINSKSDGYGGKVFQNRKTIYSGLEKSNRKNKIFASLYLRYEWVDNKNVPLIINAKVRYGKPENHHIELNAGTVYRYPNLNDLYWNPGGNPNLQPESGYSSDLSFVSKKMNLKRLKIRFVQTVFNQLIDKWILWLPGQNGVYTPNNVQQVWARGTETKLTLEYKTDKDFFEWNSSFNYTLSTITKKRFEGDNAEGKQLIYVPPYTAGSAILHTRKNFSQRLMWQYVSYRYTSLDNDVFLDGYALLNYQVNYQLKIKKIQTVLSFEVNNITNKNYEIITYRPMPGRNYRLALSFKIDQTLTHKNNKK